MLYQKLAKFWPQNVQHELFSQKQHHGGIGNLVESIFLTFFTLKPNLQSEVFQKTKFTIPRRVAYMMYTEPEKCYLDQVNEDSDAHRVH